MSKPIFRCAAVLAGVWACAAPVQAKEVKMLFSFALAPYVINDPGKEPSGFELDAIRAALALKGHTVKPVFVAMAAIPKMLKEQAADGAQRGSPDLKEDDGYYYADEPTVVYADAAITLKKNNLVVSHPADLKGKSVVSFQGASNFLGSDYAAAVKSNDKYSESSDEKRRIMQLYANGTQVYVGDVNVFKFYKTGITGVDLNQEVVFHKIFTPHAQTFNNAVFRDKQLRDDFNAGLKQLKASGEYKKIIKKYINE
jgi:polar amino acid transport system substrate-binding protein